MADQMVRAAQHFVNSVYGDAIGMTVEEDGSTGWNTMYALTRALQWELGITALSNNFGPTTLSTLATRYPVLNERTVPSVNFCRIVQAALYCKGYDGGGLDGTYGSRVRNSLVALKTDMGVIGAVPGADLVPKVFKALLTMDAYVTVNSGSDAVRRVQQWLNARYLDRRDYFVIPCDGHNSRDVAKSMLLAVQYELGMTDGTANGVFGPGTRSGLASHLVTAGSAGIWVSLFSAAMLLNQRPVAFTDTFGGALAEEVRSFQSFARLPVTGKGDFSTWASLLVSYGDQTRKGAACDGVTKITPARAAALKAEGIRYVGRYLTSGSATLLPEKVIQPGELRTIADAGLRCFPIYQTFGREAANFSYPLGRAAGYAATNAAVDHGFKDGTLIFFAVDFDALGEDITSNVLPHFKGIQDAIRDSGDHYQIGVYGPRNVCTRVALAGHSVASFVSDMSSGYSGNYGYPLPHDWAFDQFVTRTVGSGDGRIEIDNCIASGRAAGQGSFNPPRRPVPDTRFDLSLRSALSADMNSYMESIGFPTDGGLRSYSHADCFTRIVIDYDETVTSLSNLHAMRKALIQTSAYWEMRHIGIEDYAQEERVVAYHSGVPGGARDCSTGIAQVTANAAIRASNYCISNGLVTGSLLDPDSDTDVYDVWKRLRNSGDYSLCMVALIHHWGAGGKPGGSNPPAGETSMRPVSLDYREDEIFQILRRYQGWGDQAENDARKRIALYHILEKYHGISRNR